MAEAEAICPYQTGRVSARKYLAVSVACAHGVVGSLISAHDIELV